MIFFLLLIPFLVQGITIFIDEFYFHWKRGLPRWERIGHPLDTLTVIVCFAWVLWMPYSPNLVVVYALMALFSTFFVTKDEFIHAKMALPGEFWLHALLFVMHPTVLALAGFTWANVFPQLGPVVFGQFVVMVIFFFYQVIYWNRIYDKSKS